MSFPKLHLKLGHYIKPKCRLSILNLDLGHLGKKILFYFDWPLRLNHSNWFIPSGLPFLNISYLLDVWNVSIYIFITWKG
jgi:hypothetical protein